MRVHTREAVELVAVRVVPGRAERSPAVGGAEGDARDDAGDVTGEGPQPSQGDVRPDEREDRGRLVLDEVCHACGEAQGENCEYHGSAPFLVVWKLPEQGKDFRDRHHVLEFLVLVKKEGRHSAAPS